MLNRVIRIVASLEPPHRGDFGIRLESDVVSVPGVFQRIVGAHNVHTAPQLLAAIETFPSEVVDDLGWTREEVRSATNQLVSRLNLAQQDRADSAQGAFGALRPLRPGRERDNRRTPGLGG